MESATERGAPQLATGPTSRTTHALRSHRFLLLVLGLLCLELALQVCDGTILVANVLNDFVQAFLVAQRHAVCLVHQAVCLVLETVSAQHMSECGIAR